MPIIDFYKRLSFLFIEFNNIDIFCISMHHLKRFWITVYSYITTTIFPRSNNCCCKIICFKTW